MADLEDKLEKTAELKLKQGVKQGAKEKAVETARNLLNDGMAIEKIKRYTGLSKKEIEMIKN